MRKKCAKARRQKETAHWHQLERCVKILCITPHSIECCDEDHLRNTFPFNAVSSSAYDPGWKNFLSVDRSDLDSTIRAERKTRNIYIYMLCVRESRGRLHMWQHVKAVAHTPR